jgi:hypothetical protein
MEEIVVEDVAIVVKGLSSDTLFRDPTASVITGASMSNSLVSALTSDVRMERGASEPHINTNTASFATAQDQSTINTINSSQLPGLIRVNVKKHRRDPSNASSGDGRTMVSVGSSSSHAHSVSNSSIPEGRTSGDMTSGDYSTGNSNSFEDAASLKVPYKSNNSDYNSSYDSNLSKISRPLTPMPNSLLSNNPMISHSKLKVKKTVGTINADREELMICDDGWGAGSCEPDEGEI